VGDNLSILVWKSPEFTTNVPVRPDGKISLPLVGDILALGKTPISLAEDVTVKLSTYVRSPQVTVTVVGVDSAQYLARVSITGAVNRPVSVAYKQGMTVLDLVLDAGGLTIYAQGNKAKLYRKVDGKVEAFPVNVDDIIKKGNIETNYNLAPTDILTIPESTF
jgi:polysaccharide export outer membrane protein